MIYKTFCYCNVYEWLTQVEVNHYESKRFHLLIYVHYPIVLKNISMSISHISKTHDTYDQYKNALYESMCIIGKRADDVYWPFHIIKIEIKLRTWLLHYHYWWFRMRNKSLHILVHFFETNNNTSSQYINGLRID